MMLVIHAVSHNFPKKIRTPIKRLTVCVLAQVDAHRVLLSRFAQEVQLTYAAVLMVRSSKLSRSVGVDLCDVIARLFQQFGNGAVLKS